MLRLCYILCVNVYRIFTRMCECLEDIYKNVLFVVHECWIILVGLSGYVKNVTHI